MTESLSIDQARKLVLLSQRLPPKKQLGTAVTATLSAIEHLGYIQIDTISAIQRAHHHTLWNRNPRYSFNHIDILQRDKKIFEYWAHAASYLPMVDYRFSLPRKQEIARGDQHHWYERDSKLMTSVLNRISQEGPLMAKDFEHNGHKTATWSRKPAKRALENLYMQGELMVPYRINFQKVYDLTERVLPEETDISMPEPEEYGRFLITRYLRANGIGQTSEMVYLLKNCKKLVADILMNMELSGEVVRLHVANELYYSLPSSLDLLVKPLQRNKLKILSPFDNLLIQRRRMEMLFDFTYILECYMPENKRQYGYFCLPILWNGNLVARVDCRADRKKSELHILNLMAEQYLTKHDEFIFAFCKELTSFLKFNECSSVRIHKTAPASLKALFQSALSDHRIH